MFIAILLTLSMFAKYIPFLQEDNELGLIFNSTNFGGAANQIPIFGGTPITSLDKAKEIRKKLVENGLSAIINLPSGVFNPYSAVKTSILLINKNIKSDF